MFGTEDGPFEQKEELNVIKLSHSEIQMVKSEDIKVGQILWLQDDEIIPVDCIVLQTPNTDGSCMVSTGQLDGERALKPKYALIKTQNDLPDIVG